MSSKRSNDGNAALIHQSGLLRTTAVGDKSAQQARLLVHRPEDAESLGRSP